MEGRSITLLSLPEEILIKIFRPLLQYTAEQPPQWIPYGFIKDPESTSYAYVVPSSNHYLYVFPRPDAEQFLQPQLLRVCRRFNEIGTSLLYANTIIFMANIMWAFEGQETLDGQRGYLSRLARSPRDDAHRLRRVQVLVHTPENYSWTPTPADGEFLDEIFASLALHQPCWDDVLISVNDSSRPTPYRADRATAQRVLYGLGRLHCKGRVETAGVTRGLHDDLAWAIKQPRHTYPLWVLHEDLKQYLAFYDSFDEEPSDGQQQIDTSEQPTSRKEVLMQQSQEAAESRHEEAFYRVIDAAVEHVNGGLPGHLERGDFSPDERETYLKTARTHGDHLLSAKQRAWRGGFTLGAR